MKPVFKKLHIIIASTICLFTSLYGLRDKNFFDKIDAAAQSYIAKHHMPGIVLLITGEAKDGERLSKVLVYGENAQDSKIDFNGYSVMPIGTFSETFIGGLLAKKISLGKIKIGDPIYPYLPKSLQMPSLKKYTIADLAAHHAGMSDIPIDFFSQKKLKSGGLKKLIVNSKFKVSSCYSKLDYILLAEILSNSTGLSFHQWAQKEFSQIGLKDTVFFLTKGLKSRLAKGNSEARGHLASQFIPALGLYSTPQNLLRWMEICLDSSDRAWGWEERSFAGEDHLFKESNLFGFNMRFYLSKKTGRGIAFLANLEGSLDECEQELLPCIKSLF